MHNVDGENGHIMLAVHYFTIYGEEEDDEESEDTDSQQNNGSQKFGGIEVSVTRNGPWSPVRLNYGLGPAPWHLGRDYLASEMVIHEGVKHLFVRTLVTLMNETECFLEARLCPDFLVGQETDGNGLGVNNLENSVEEEIFENQRTQPGKGWVNPTLPTDPGHWCRRDLSGSSKVEISCDFDLFNVCKIILYPAFVSFSFRLIRFFKIDHNLDQHFNIFALCRISLKFHFQKVGSG